MVGTLNQQLLWAIKNNDVARVDELIQLGADVNYSDIYEGAALTCAIHQQNIPILALLIRHGVDVNKVNIFNISPIESAIKTDNTDVVHLLMNHGAVLRQEVSFFYQQKVKSYLKSLTHPINSS